MAKGLDCGTSYYITATEDSIKKQRNVFLTVDGDEDESDEYLHHKLVNVAKRTEGIGGVVGIPALGDFVKGK